MFSEYARALLADIKSFTEPLSYLATICGTVALVLAYRSWREGRKTLHFSVITNCTSRYQKLADDLTNAEKPLTMKKARQYLELCSEELFYFETEYLPLPVVLEWLDGMLSCIPLRHVSAEFDDSIPRQKCVNTPEEGMPAPFFEDRRLWSLIPQYPRLDYVFCLTDEAKQMIDRAGESHLATAQKTLMLKSLQRNLNRYQHQHPFRSLLVGRWHPRRWRKP